MSDLTPTAGAGDVIRDAEKALFEEWRTHSPKMVTDGARECRYLRAKRYPNSARVKGGQRPRRRRLGPAEIHPQRRKEPDLE